MMKVDNVDCMVWCRNGNVCLNATPCENLKCEYKKEETDILNGIKKCATYQVTVISSWWESAYQLSNDIKFLREK